MDHFFLILFQRNWSECYGKNIEHMILPSFFILLRWNVREIPLKHDIK